MKKTLAGIIILSFLVIPVAFAQENKINTIEGKLNAYDTDFVTVKNDKIMLCPGCRILDDVGNESSTNGLTAAETVRVKVGEKCATEVRIVVIRR